MNKKGPSRELESKIPEGGSYGPERPSVATSRPVSAKAGTGSSDSPSPDNDQCHISTLLTDEDIQRFQELYQARFGATITREDAHEQGIKLLRLMELVYRPMTEEEYRRVQERRQQMGLPETPDAGDDTGPSGR